MRKLLIIICAFLLAACSSSSGEAGLEQNDAPEYPTLIWYTPGPPPADFDIGMENINRYIERELGIRLDMRILLWPELNEMLLQVANTEKYFDIMFVGSDHYNTLANLGAFYDITDIARDIVPDLWAFIPENVWAGVRIGGRIYSVPTYKDIALTQFWVFDREMADAGNVDVRALETWDDLDAALRRIKAAKGEDFYPVQLSRNETFGGIFNGYDSFCNGLPIVGIRLDDPQTRVICALEDDLMIARLEKLRQWHLDGIINPDANTTTVNLPRRFFSGVGWPGAEWIWQRNEGIDEVVSTRIFGPMLSSESVQGSLNAISNNSAHKDDALRLLELVNLDPILRDMFAFGVEGIHFEYVGDRVVRQLNNNWNIPIFSQATFFTMSTTTEWPANQWELVKAQNDMAVESPLYGFSMDVSELSTELLACRAIWDKYAIDFLTGAADLDTAVAQCLAELRAAGLDILISEAQKQIDAFVAVRSIGG